MCGSLEGEAGRNVGWSESEEIDEPLLNTSRENL